MYWGSERVSRALFRWIFYTLALCPALLTGCPAAVRDEKPTDVPSEGAAVAGAAVAGPRQWRAGDPWPVLPLLAPPKGSRPPDEWALIARADLVVRGQLQRTRRNSVKPNRYMLVSSGGGPGVAPATVVAFEMGVEAESCQALVTQWAAEGLAVVMLFAGTPTTGYVPMSACGWADDAGRRLPSRALAKLEQSGQVQCSADISWLLDGIAKGTKPLAKLAISDNRRLAQVVGCVGPRPFFSPMILVENETPGNEAFRLLSVNSEAHVIDLMLARAFQRDLCSELWDRSMSEANEVCVRRWQRFLRWWSPIGDP